MFRFSSIPTNQVIGLYMKHPTVLNTTSLWIYNTKTSLSTTTTLLHSVPCSVPTKIFHRSYATIIQNNYQYNQRSLQSLTLYPIALQYRCT